MRIENIEHILKDKHLSGIYEYVFVPESKRVINCIPAVVAFNAALECIDNAEKGEKLNLDRYDKRYKNPLRLNKQLIALLIFKILQNKKRLSVAKCSLKYEAMEMVTYKDFRRWLLDDEDNPMARFVAMSRPEDLERWQKQFDRASIINDLKDDVIKRGQRFIDENKVPIELVGFINLFLNEAWPGIPWKFHLPAQQDQHHQDLQEIATAMRENAGFKNYASYCTFIENQHLNTPTDGNK